MLLSVLTLALATQRANSKIVCVSLDDDEKEEEEINYLTLLVLFFVRVPRKKQKEPSGQERKLEL